ncbi:type IV secretory system conjugative DNA transfer family protein [Halomarina halobia]|uniref:Type IV secretory system conjugative DNA transfer family protein n=1 Tax=Halomarina halobia TaxID=3033386 RepID=A0ABD6AFA3_9EURY|nr:type IV secretion system DNA-binding domain-containing protein [Halomarina sp. PSR21]
MELVTDLASTVLTVAALGYLGVSVSDFGLGTRFKPRLRERWWRLSTMQRRALLGGLPVLIYVAWGAPAAVWSLILIGLVLGWRRLAATVRRLVRRQAFTRAARQGFVLPMGVGLTGGGASGLVARVAALPILGRLVDLTAATIERPTSMLALGTTGSGKTEVGKTLVWQLTDARRGDEPIVAFDYKTDYQDFLREVCGEDAVIRVSASGSTHIWNVFQEVDDERDYRELARALFPADGDGSAKFFEQAARDVFRATCVALDREYREDPDVTLSNALLARTFREFSREDLYEALSEHGDMAAATSALDPDGSRQSVGVYATVQQRVADVFVGDFAGEAAARADEAAAAAPTHTADAEISIREYMRNPQGRVLVLDFPQRQGQTVAPIFRFLVDHAAMHALDDASRGAYFILDEATRIPGLRRLDDLVNLGRGQQVQVLLTLQSVSQLFANYGKERGTSILSGLVSRVILRLGDEASIDYARTVVGTEFKTYTKHVEKDHAGDFSVTKRRELKEEEEHAFARGEFTRWNPGVGLFIGRTGWRYGYFPMLDDQLAVEIDEAHART